MQTSNLLALTENSLKTAKATAKTDRWVWGRVTGLTPTAVLLDGENHSIYPSDVLCKLTVGMRVLVRLSGMRAIVMGADGTQYEPVEVDEVSRTVVRPGVYRDGRIDPPIGLSGSCRSGIISISWGGKLGRLGGVPYAPPNNFDHLVLQEAYSRDGEWNDIGVVTSGGLSLDRQSRVGSSLWFRGVPVDIRGERFEGSEPFEIPVSNQLAVDVANALGKAEQAGTVASQAQDTLTRRLNVFQETIDSSVTKADAAVAATVEMHNSVAEIQSRLANLSGSDDLFAGLPWFGDWVFPSPYYSKSGDRVLACVVEEGDGVNIEAVSPPVTWKQGHHYLLEMDFLPTNTLSGVQAYFDTQQAGFFVFQPLFPDGLLSHDSGSVFTARFSLKLKQTDYLGTETDSASLPLKFFIRQIVDEKHYREMVTLLGRPRLYDVTNNSYVVSAIQNMQSELQSLTRKIDEKPSLEDVERTVAKSASGKNTITYSETAPTGSGSREGDTWFRRTSDGTITGQWEWDGRQWVARRVGSEVVASLDVGKLTAGTVVTPEAVVEKLWADGISSRTVNTARLTVASGSLWLDDKFETGINIFFEREVKDDKACLKYVQNGELIRFWKSQVPSPFRQDRAELVVELDIYSTTEITDSFPQVAVEVTKADGSKSDFYGEREVKNIPANSWHRLRYELLVNSTNVVALNPWLRMNFKNGSTVWVANPRIVAKTGTVLIEDGAVTAPKLTVGQGMIDKLTVSSDLWTGKLTTEMLRVGNYVNGVSIDRYGVKIKGSGSVELTAGGFVAKNSSGVTTVKIGVDGNAVFKGTIQAGSMISAPQIKGGTINGTKITSAVYQTAETGRRIVIDSSGIRQYDSGNNLFALYNDDSVRFYNKGESIGFIERTYEKDKPYNVGVALTVSENSNFIALSTVDKSGKGNTGHVWVMRDDVKIRGTSWNELVSRAFNAPTGSQMQEMANYVSQALSTASQANGVADSAYKSAINAYNLAKSIDSRRLGQLFVNFNALVSWLNSWGLTIANGGKVSPGSFSQLTV